MFELAGISTKSQPHGKYMAKLKCRERLYSSNLLQILRSQYHCVCIEVFWGFFNKVKLRTLLSYKQRDEDSCGSLISQTTKGSSRAKLWTSTKFQDYF